MHDRYPWVAEDLRALGMSLDEAVELQHENDAMNINHPDVAPLRYAHVVAWLRRRVAEEGDDGEG